MFQGGVEVDVVGDGERQPELCLLEWNEVGAGLDDLVDTSEGVLPGGAAAGEERVQAPRCEDRAEAARNEVEDAVSDAESDPWQAPLEREDPEADRARQSGRAPTRGLWRSPRSISIEAGSSQRCAQAGSAAVR